MSENATGAQGGADLDHEACFEQKQRAKKVEKELRKMAGRLEQDKIASVFHLQVYGFQCENRRHTGVVSHVDYVAGGTGHLNNNVQVVIKALEHALSELRKRVQ